MLRSSTGKLILAAAVSCALPLLVLGASYATDVPEVESCKSLVIKDINGKLYYFDDMSFDTWTVLDLKNHIKTYYPDLNMFVLTRQDKILENGQSLRDIPIEEIRITPSMMIHMNYFRKLWVPQAKFENALTVEVPMHWTFAKFKDYIAAERFGRISSNNLITYYANSSSVCEDCAVLADLCEGDSRMVELSMEVVV
ncbi:MAG: hypothetical protein H6850_01770 [Alphaproteobacteria bacterium]|nr:MAG: hypothetical protein H6850_01770 [Alphaproteobacteria bacterium]